MANCKNCAAPLPPESNICAYCKTRNDVDLTGLHRYSIHQPESERICPRCNIPLQTIDLKVDGRLLIEKCSNCMGMFFDLGELEALVDRSVKNVYHIDFKQLGNFNNVKRHDEYPVTYIKCPVCSKLMHRLNYGSQSGVIIDTCKHCGIWLDGGELRQILEWVKAGGQMLHEQKTAEMQTIRAKAEEQKRRAAQQIMVENDLDPRFANYDRMGGRRGLLYGESDVLDVVSKVVSSFFKF